ncbi:MAG: hypothetical protein MJZ30_12040 [Paludibacteraceae bacterium]|nr:hypothetical protein [Paludibacteraceae bacterium]
MLYDKFQNLRELKERGTGAVLGNIETDPMQWGFVNAKDLISCIDEGKPIRVMDMDGMDPVRVLIGFNPTNTVIAEYATIEEMLDAGWRLD